MRPALARLRLEHAGGLDERAHLGATQHQAFVSRLELLDLCGRRGAAWKVREQLRPLSLDPCVQRLGPTPNPYGLGREPRHDRLTHFADQCCASEEALAGGSLPIDGER